MTRATALTTIITTALATLLACACTDSVELPADELYTRAFIKEFGVPDAHHDWSMATTINITADFGSEATGTLYIYSATPIVESSHLLGRAELTGGKAALKINARKGSRFVYASLCDGAGKELYAGWQQVRDGEMAIAANQGISRSAASQSAEGVTLSERVDIDIQRMPDDFINYLTSHTSDSYNEAYGWGATYPFNNFVTENVPRLYTIEGIKIGATDADPMMSVAEARRLFDYYTDSRGEQVDGVFREGEDNIRKYVWNDILSTDIIFETAEAGEVTLNCVWRGVGNQADKFGYYYYTADGDKMLTPLQLWNETNKYILIGGSDDYNVNRISGKSALTQRSRYISASATDSGEYMSWEDNEGLTGEWLMGELHKIERGENADRTVHTDDMLRGATLLLPYFGPDGTLPATYDWPAGVRIGFFMFSTTDTWPISHTRKFFVSNCLNNYYLFNHAYGEQNPWSGAPWSADNLVYGKYKRPYSVHFRYGSKDYLAMADGGNDFDLNDLVFTITNLKRPTKDVTPDDPVPTPAPETWILACEDLGNADDYDFNDIVLGISHVAGESHATVTPLACGGELSSEVYYNGEFLGEIHMMCGVGYGVIAGTGLAETGIATPVRINVDANEGINEIAAKFAIRTLYNDNNKPTGTWITAPNTDTTHWNVPQMLLLPGSWQWPVERHHITKAYPEFALWVGNSNYTEWNKTCVKAHVVQRP